LSARKLQDKRLRTVTHDLGQYAGINHDKLSSTLTLDRKSKCRFSQFSTGA